MPDETPTPDTGSELGPFRLGNRLGVGGMGIVFQALDTQLNRQVALKVITPHIGDNPEFRARFTREAQAQASLDSPHVVQVYSFGEADGRLYIASQLIPDGDLGQMLHQHGRPPARIAVNLISQVADGLADAHAAGLIHRDIKPANVLLRNRDNQLQAYLGDFGIARQVGASTITQAGGTVGTPSYMAPELHLGAEAGPTSDVYSLGCLLWAALSCKAPYAGSTDYQVVMAHVEQPIPQLAPTGPLAAEVNRVLRTAMAKSATDRYQTAAAMRDDLRRVVRLPDDPTPARPADPTPVPEATQPWSLPPATPTPTPTPTPAPAPAPAPLAKAPVAPPFRPVPPPPTPAPQYSTSPTPPPGGYPGYPSGPSGPSAPAGRGGGNGRLFAILAVVAVLVIGGVLAAVLLTGGDGGDDPQADPSGSGSASQSSSGSSQSAGDREATALASLSAAFSTDGTTADKAASDCFARSFVDQYGVDRLVEDGLLDPDTLDYIDDPDNTKGAATLLGGITQATFSCINELSGS